MKKLIKNLYKCMSKKTCCILLIAILIITFASIIFFYTTNVYLSVLIIVVLIIVGRTIIDLLIYCEKENEKKESPTYNSPKTIKNTIDNIKCCIGCLLVNFWLARVLANMLYWTLILCSIFILSFIIYGLYVTVFHLHSICLHSFIISWDFKEGLNLIYNTFSKNEDGLTLTIIAGLITAILGYIHNRRTTFAQIISKARVEYIENLRKALAKFYEAVCNSNASNTCCNDIQSAGYALISYFNREEPSKIDEKIIDTIELIMSNNNFCKIDMLKKLSKDIAAVIDLEWQGIKREADSSNFNNPCVLKYHQYKCRKRILKIENQ